jgi:hypothetical protein
MIAPAPVVTAPPGGLRAWCEHQGPFRPVQHAVTGLIMLPHQRMAHRARASLDSADHPTLSRLRSAAPWREDPRHHRRIRFLLHQPSDLLYLLAISYGVSANPAVSIAFVNVLNPCSIYLTYRLGTAMLGPPVRADHLGALRCFPDGCPEWEGALVYCSPLRQGALELSILWLTQQEVSHATSSMGCQNERDDRA